MIRAGLTGGIGSGKSTVARVFKELGVPVFHADEVSRSLLADEEVKKRIVEVLGREILDGSGNIDRKKTAGLVFRDQEKLSALNAILHPIVRQRFDAFCREHSDSPYVIEEAAILFESGAYKTLDKFIVVECAAEERIKRVMERDVVSREAVLDRMKNQMPDTERRAKAHFVIDNSGKEAILPQVIAIHEKLGGKTG